MAWKLVDSKTGDELMMGGQAKTSRGEVVTLCAAEPPKSPQSTGRVYCVYADGDSGDWYPSVIGAKFIGGET